MPTIPPQQAGNSFAGSFDPAIGAIRNVNARRAAYDSADITYAVDAVITEGVEVACHVNGDLVDAVPSTISMTSVAGLDEGDHSLALYLNRSDGIWPDRHGDQYGQRAWLKWDRSTDATCYGYKVYSDEGAGATPETLVDTITDCTIDDLQNETPHTGTGVGRLSAFGAYLNAAGTVNGNLYVQILDASAGTFEYGFGGDTYDGVFSAGDSITLLHGCVVTFHDDAEDYADGDLWNIGIGPRNTYLSPTLSPGTYRYAIEAIDETLGGGNESVTDHERTVYIPTLPEPVTGVTLTWDAGDEELQVTWTPPATCDSIRVYANWSTIFGTFQDYVIEENHWQELAANATGFTFSTAEIGTLLFYVFPVLDDIERRDMALHTFNFPPTPAEQDLVLSSPTSLTAEPYAGGKIYVTWDYRFTNDSITGTVTDDLDHFDVFIVSALPFDYETPYDTVSGEGSGWPAAQFSLLTDDTFGALQYVAVRAVTTVLAGSVNDGNTAYVTVTPDATAPTFAGDMIGGAQ